GDLYWKCRILSFLFLDGLTKCIHILAKWKAWGWFLAEACEWSSLTPLLTHQGKLEMKNSIVKPEFFIKWFKLLKSFLISADESHFFDLCSHKP
ncbi:hypothetical protein Pfo_007665, partial [Paulownia fortunei]